MTKKSVRTHSDEGRFALAEQYALGTVAFVLASAMGKSKFSQRELAQRLGVTEARISQLLNANGNPTVKTLARVADALNHKVTIRFVELDAADRRDSVGATISAASVAVDGVVALEPQPEPDNIIRWTSNDRLKRAWSRSEPDPTPPNPEPLYGVL